MRTGRHTRETGRPCYVARYFHHTTGESVDYIDAPSKEAAETFAADTAAFYGAEVVSVEPGTIPATLNRNEDLRRVV